MTCAGCGDDRYAGRGGRKADNGGEAPVEIRFHLEGADWWRETLRVYWSRNNGDWHAIGDIKVDPTQGSYSIPWNGPEDEGTGYRIKIEEVLP